MILSRYIISFIGLHALLDSHRFDSIVYSGENPPSEIIIIITSLFADFVEYKSIWYGKKLVEIDQWFPSSQLCSECGYRNRELTLNDREWVCIECGCVHDRDVNASINIKNQGLNILSGSWTDSDVKQKRLELLSDVLLCNNNEIDKAVKVEALESLAQGSFTK